MGLADRIKNSRKAKRYTQKDLARLMHVKPATISSWEVGRNEPSLNMLKQLSSTLGVSFEYLAGTPTKKAKSLDEALDNVMSFDGKPVTEHDKKVMKQLWEAYLASKE
ncbi:helix-turn-helix domain-containing protein [Limosilactobacillus antri]|uniref:helix-turn-helix domain-containing protein n=1 Tax=Limosilactobacillus antri TaxID=227943 RepID=UPI001F5787DD|nr:helix-turn-helix transcriptional regulator [Limosilactobacillus antri]